MGQAIFIEESQKHYHQDIISQVYRLRHDTFIDRLGWDIQSENGLERDSFDEMNPYHIAIRDKYGDVAGCWRAMPTTGDYMLRSIFPELLQGEATPDAEDVWEISRFAIRKNHTCAVKGYSSQVMIDMMESLYGFAVEHNINRYVAVTTVGFERILRKLGLTIRRLGEGQSMQIGVERSVAIFVEVNEKMKISMH